MYENKHIIMLVCLFIFCLLSVTAEENLLINSDFTDGFSGWIHYGQPGRFKISKGDASILVYEKTKNESMATSENTHLDQIVQVKPGKLYVAAMTSKKVKGELLPALRIASKDWQTITLAISESSNWRRNQAYFRPKEEMIRFQIFAGAQSPALESSPGISQIKDACLREFSLEEIKALHKANIHIDVNQQQRPVSSLFFGVNALFWIEDDASRKDGKIAKFLKEMPCNTIRFPGGEVADNYHWETNILDDKGYWPYSDGSDKMDTDEFIPWCRSIGSEPVFVTNLDSWARIGDLELGAREAAKWVRHCNVSNSYGVKYWEIGNETYLKQTRFPMTAREYGRAVKLYSDAMKAVDPLIKIGAVGPHSPGAIAPIEFLPSDALNAVRSIQKKNERTSIMDNILQKVGRRSGEPWWPAICEEAQDAFDFAVVHQYKSPYNYDSFLFTQSFQGEMIENLTSYFKTRYPDRNIPIALTEWNTNRNTEAKGMGQALMLAELVMEYLESGVEMAHFWPLRLGSKSSHFRALLDRETNDPRAPFHILKLFASNVKGYIVSSDSDNITIRVMACLEKRDHAAIFLLNKNPSPEGVFAKISISGNVGRMFSITSLTAESVDSTQISYRHTDISMHEGNLEITLQPHSMTLVKSH